MHADGSRRARTYTPDTRTGYLAETTGNVTGLNVRTSSKRAGKYVFHGQFLPAVPRPRLELEQVKIEVGSTRGCDLVLIFISSIPCLAFALV